MVDKLEECPFCGKPGQSAKTEWGSFAAGCLTENCPAENGAYDFVTAESAAAHWNTRATPTEDARERVKVLEEALGNLLTYIGHDGKRVYSTDLVVVKAISALGNKETNRHG